MTTTQTTTQLTPAQRKKLKQQAFSLKPVVLLGQKGLTEAVHAEIELALEAHELIKIQLTGASREDRVAYRDVICEKHRATPIAKIGRKLTVYRKRVDAS